MKCINTVYKIMHAGVAISDSWRLQLEDVPKSGDEFVETVVENLKSLGICYRFRCLFNDMCHFPAICKPIDTGSPVFFHPLLFQASLMPSGPWSSAASTSEGYRRPSGVF